MILETKKLQFQPKHQL